MSATYRVVFESEAGEVEQCSVYLTLRAAADEAWHLRRLGLVAWVEERS